MSTELLNNAPAGAAPVRSCSCGHIIVPGESQAMTGIEKWSGFFYKCNVEGCECRTCILMRSCYAYNTMLQSMGFPLPRYSN
jgi:hypothetical protein